METPEELRQFKYARMKTIYDNSMRIAKENQRLRDRERQLVEALREATKVCSETLRYGYTSAPIYALNEKIESLLNNQPDEK